MKGVLVKFENILFVVLLFAQNFALIKTKSFGIAGLTIFLVFMFFIHKLYKYNLMKLIKISCVFAVVVVVEFIINNYFNIIRLMRWEMIIFIIYSTFYYLKSKDKSEFEQIVEYLFKFGFVIGIYGIYQFIAPLFRWPLFLNILQNNPSYSVDKNLYYYYSGWVNTSRIYTLFSEPSFYAIFLVILTVILIIKNNVKYKNLYLAMYLLNIAITYSRGGWGVLLFLICFYPVSKILVKHKMKKAHTVLYILILLIPLVSIIMMYLLNTFVFNDLSSSARTNSTIYYLKHSFDSIKYLICGHGLGYMQGSYTPLLFKTEHVEAFAHNGYVEVLYELGLIGLTSMILLLNYATMKIKNYDARILFAIVASSINMFGAFYSVESILVILVLFYFISINSKVVLTFSKCNNFFTELFLRNKKG